MNYKYYYNFLFLLEGNFTIKQNYILIIKKSYDHYKHTSI